MGAPASGGRVSLEVGSTLAPLRVARIDAASMKLWSKLLHDPNPIHLDRDAVRAMGLGDRLLNQGPANLACIISMLLGALPGARVESLDVRYVDNAFEGDSVEANGRITEILPGSPPRIVCEVSLQAIGRGPVIQGAATLILAGPPSLKP
jgi:3-hydroxybutyryl-CoA dehydratase